MGRKFIHKEAFNLLCGRLIGEGCSRKVFECRIDASLVVKVEENAGSFHNISEYELWQNYQSTPAGKWLVPCVDLSPCGAVLIQKRAEPLRRADLPENVPSFLTDLKLENFGFFDGQVVCCDYATVIYSPSMRMKRAKWCAHA